jgi:hypothetical protein
MPLANWVARLQEANADELVIAFDLIKEAGARNSKKDAALLQTIHDHTVALGAGCATKEAVAVDIVGDIIPLKEGAVGQDGTAYLKLIAPGWGSSGFYSSEVLKRDGPRVFPAGTKNFWDHQTAAEESARPEGSLRDLASVLTEDAHWDDNGPAGAGLYAKAKVFEQFRQPVDDLSKHIGVSIRANGRAKEGAADGKKGPIIEQLTRGISADYVTTPGAGGKILQLFEAARGRESTQGDNDMDEATVKRLIAEATAPLIAENKKLKEAIAADEAPKVKRGKTIKRMLEGINLPGVYRDLLIERVKAKYPLTEAGVTDETRLKALVEKELGKIAEQLSKETGRVVNLGPAPTVDPKLREAAGQEWDKQFSESMHELADEFMDHNEESDPKAVERRRNLFTNGRAA